MSGCQLRQGRGAQLGFVKGFFRVYIGLLDDLTGLTCTKCPAHGFAGSCSVSQQLFKVYPGSNKDHL